MKKLLSVFAVLLLAFVFVGCTEDTTSVTSEPVVYSVIAPNGSPAIAQMYMQQDSAHYAVDIVSGPDPLLAAFGSGSHDFIFAPTNLGAKLYTANQSYIFIAAVTFGNYYLVTSTENTFDLASLAGKEIVVFGQNQTSDIVLKYVLSENEITASFSYVADVATAVSTWVADNSKIVMVAEPSLSVLLASHPDLDVIDLQTAYEDITGSNSYPQAGVFAKATLSNEAIDQFLVDLEASIDSVNANVADSATLGVDLGFGFPYAVLVNAIPNSHLDFQGALEVKSSLEAYFSIILDLNPVLIGNALPVDDFYYQPE